MKTGQYLSDAMRNLPDGIMLTFVFQMR